MFNLTANYTASGNKPTLSVGICLQPQIESEFAGLKFHRSVWVLYFLYEYVATRMMHLIIRFWPVKH